MQTRKSKAHDALKANDTSPHVALELAKVFESEKKNEKARRWYERATKLQPEFGDAWAWFVRFLEIFEPESVPMVV